jgi:hypothetical protein
MRIREKEVCENCHGDLAIALPIDLQENTSRLCTSCFRSISETTRKLCRVWDPL